MVRRLRFAHSGQTVQLLASFAEGEFCIFDVDHMIKLSDSRYLKAREIKAIDVDWLPDGTPLVGREKKKKMDEKNFFFFFFSSVFGWMFAYIRSIFIIRLQLSHFWGQPGIKFKSCYCFSVHTATDFFPALFASFIYSKSSSWTQSVVIARSTRLKKIFF
jgi:hypothetical protein